MLIRALDRLLKRLVISLFNLILHSIGHSLTHLFVVDDSFELHIRSRLD